MKRLIALLLFPWHTMGQVTEIWEQPTGGVMVAVDSLNNVYTLNYEYNLGAEMSLTKRDKDGNLIWTASYNQTDNTKWERAEWVATDRNGNIIVCGTYMSGLSNPVVAASIVMKFSPDGTLLWRNVYESSFDGSSVKKCLVDAANNIYVLGMGSGPAGYVTKIKKFAPDGSTLWTYYDADGIGSAINFKFTPDGALVIVGRSIFGSVNGFAKIDLSGNKIWSYTGLMSVSTCDAAGDALGNTYIVHTQYVINGTTQIKKLNSAGTIVWDNVYPFAGNRIEVGTDNSAVVSGFPASSQSGAAFLKVDPNGTLLWQNADADGPSVALLNHSLLLLDKNNDAYLAGGILFNASLCKVFSNGTSAWTYTGISGNYTTGFAFGIWLNSIFVCSGIATARLDDATMPALCQTPDNIYFDNITQSTIRINWSPVPNAQQYEVWRKQSNKTTWKVSTVSATKNNKNYKNLSCGKSYDFKMRTVCNAQSGIYSPFSPTLTVSTSACRLQQDEAVAEEKLSVDPNPVSSSGQIIVHVPNRFVGSRLTLSDMQGNVVYSRRVHDNLETIGTARFAPGSYVLAVTSANGRHAVLLVIE